MAAPIEDPDFDDTDSSVDSKCLKEPCYKESLRTLNLSEIITKKLRAIGKNASTKKQPKRAKIVLLA